MVQKAACRWLGLWLTSITVDCATVEWGAIIDAPMTQIKNPKICAICRKEPEGFLIFFALFATFAVENFGSGLAWLGTMEKRQEFRLTRGQLSGWG